MFNRSKNQPATDANDAAKQQAEAVSSGAKGRATPSRKEREAANRRPLVPADRKAARSVDRERLRTEREKQQAGLAAGDERYLPARDKGPQKRYARDFVDARWTVGEFMMPVVVVLLFGTMFVQSALPATVSSYVIFITYGFILLTALDCVVIGFQLRKRLVAKFGSADRGLRWYATMRAIQMRFMRMPKPQSKRGEFPA
ncbi:MAG: DUF3043 domain-containing protein [Microbacteriaceae bacterium]|nr:DUF3043 domain-containing protein [Microbacteriaceae bacterium]MCL2794932.1 DUF3043 domain-containing protein [Microbacteriaceae bacterium]